MDHKQIWLAFQRLESALQGVRSQNIPLDPGRKHTSFASIEQGDLAHSFDVLIDVLRIIELEIDGYRRPFLALRLERMEQLGLLQSDQALNLWKRRSDLFDPSSSTYLEAKTFFTTLMIRLRAFIESRFSAQPI